MKWKQSNWKPNSKLKLHQTIMSAIKPLTHNMLEKSIRKRTKDTILIKMSMVLLISRLVISHDQLIMFLRRQKFLQGQLQIATSLNSTCKKQKRMEKTWKKKCKNQVSRCMNVMHSVLFKITMSPTSKQIAIQTAETRCRLIHIKICTTLEKTIQQMVVTLISN